MNSLAATNRKDEELRKVLENLFGNIDDALFEFMLPLLEWKEILGNEYLFHQGDKGNNLYILISGRMQIIIRYPDQTEKIVGEISRGESIGEMSIFTDSPRSEGIKAIRNSQLISISREVYERIVRHSPAINRNIIKLLINRLKKHDLGEKPSQKVCNIALIPLSKSVRLAYFTHQLENEMSTHGKVLNLTSGRVNQMLDNNQVSSATNNSSLYNRFSDWLENKEYENDFLLFQGDASPTEWTKRCLRQADEIIFIADAEQSPDLTELEETLLNSTNSITTASQKLVLLHKKDEITNTNKWLQNRPVKSCYHVRHKSENDMKKLARFITGNAVGLVLSGGGAKSLSHIGVYRALKDYGIPVDYVGGTSIGSIVASMIAMDKSPTEIYEISQEIFMSNPASLGDYNLFPIISLLGGRQMDKAIKDSLGNKRIEDMPTNFFCVSANLSNPQMAVHERGLIGQAVRASISLPGVFPPAILDNDLHIDGGMVNNLPIDVMEKMDVKHTIAVDLDSCKTTDIKIAKMPTGWQYLTSKIFKRKQYSIPNIMSTMMQSIMITSVEKTRTNRSKADLYINPNVSKFGLMEWEKFHQIEEIGYLDTIQILDNWKGFQ